MLHKKLEPRAVSKIYQVTINLIRSKDSCDGMAQSKSKPMTYQKYAQDLKIDVTETGFGYFAKRKGQKICLVICVKHVEIYTCGCFCNRFSMILTHPTLDYI